VRRPPPLDGHLCTKVCNALHRVAKLIHEDLLRVLAQVWSRPPAGVRKRQSECKHKAQTPPAFSNKKEGQRRGLVMAQEPHAQ